MKVRRFYGENICQVLEEVKRELGREAVILESRQLAVAGRPRVEVVAAVDFTAAGWPPAAKERPGRPAGSAGSPAGAQPAAPPGPPPYRELQREIIQVKRMLNRLLGATGLEGDWAATGPFADFYRRLREHGLPEESCRELLDQALAGLPAGRPVAAEVVSGCLARLIIARLRLQPAAGLGRLVTLVGPTGVGKTTTAAKLAAYFQRQRDEKVGMVTVDSFRLGATAQIREYGRRLQVPVRTAYSRADLEQAVREYADCDRIIIDTTGRSHRDAAGLEQLATVLGNCCSEKGTQLVVPVGVREEDFLDILVSFRRFACQGLLFSKLDESSAHGMLYHGADLASLPLSFFTTGQLVPEDLEPATGERVAALLLDINH